ncbi:MAG: transposase [Mangrovibacterium sp.]
MGYLKLEQRYAIAAYLKSGKTKVFIAKQLGFDESTIRREIKRNSTKRGMYNTDFAQELANERKERFAINRKFDVNMKQYIDRMVTSEQWSPQQIKGICDKESKPMVCVERIYQYIREGFRRLYL